MVRLNDYELKASIASEISSGPHARLPNCMVARGLQALPEVCENLQATNFGDGDNDKISADLALLALQAMLPLVPLPPLPGSPSTAN